MMIKGLYVITDSGTLGDGIVEAVELALKGGAKVVQYRAKDRTAENYRQHAYELREMTRIYGAALIINDDLTLTKEVGADGVHIGRADAGLLEARQAVGRRRIIGVSCYNELSLALEAQSDGANYIAFGSVFQSSIKPGAVHAPVSFIARAIPKLSIPVVAIGGINADNCTSLIQAGVDSVAVISGVFDQPNIETAARQISQLFKTEKEKI